MYKIHGVLFATLLSMSFLCLSLDQEKLLGSPINSSWMSTEDQRTFDELEKEIEIIKKENDDPHFRSNTCWKTTGSLVLFSAIFQNFGLVFVAEGLAYLYGGAGGYTRMDENEQIKEREAKINVLKNKQEEMLAQYEHNKLGS